MSIIIPTIGSERPGLGARRVFVVEAVRSLLATTDHANLEVVVVYDDAHARRVLEQLREVAGDRLILVPFAEPFNFSRKMNLGVLHATRRPPRPAQRRHGGHLRRLAGAAGGAAATSRTSA